MCATHCHASASVARRFQESSGSSIPPTQPPATKRSSMLLRANKPRQIAADRLGRENPSGVTDISPGSGRPLPPYYFRTSATLGNRIKEFISLAPPSSGERDKRVRGFCFDRSVGSILTFRQPMRIPGQFPVAVASCLADRRESDPVKAVSRGHARNNNRETP
jgi:hypothetical protein